MATDIASFFAAIGVKNFHSFHTIGSYSTESKAKACGPMMREDNGTIIVPLLAEDVSITKQRVVTGSVEVSTVSRRHEHLVNELLTRESVEIERVPVGQIVKCAPQVREEGDTLIIPVMEEVLVIERRLILKEEVRVRRVRTTEKHQERVHLRRQEAVVTRHSSQMDKTSTTEVAARNQTAGTEKHDS